MPSEAPRKVHRKTIDHLPDTTWYDKLNKKVALIVTKGVGTMWCAYAFAVFDLLALPTALRAGLFGFVQWMASFFLQLVLLSVIMVGQNLSNAAADARAEKTFEDTEKIIDRLEITTEGGIKELYDKLHAEIEAIKPARRKKA